MSRCSFCSRTAEVAGSIVAGPRSVGICADCASLAVDVATEASRPDEPDRVVGAIGCLITNDSRRDGLLGWVPEAAVAIRRGRVSWVGPERHLPERYATFPRMDAGGRIACPGFVDAGTSLLGSDLGRDPAPAVDRAADAAAAMIQAGVTAFDLRIGGGLDPMAETVALAAGRMVAERVAGSVMATWVVSVGFDPRVVREVMLPAASRLARNAVVACAGPPHAIDRLVEAIHPLRPRVEVCDEPAECADVAHGALSIGGPGHVEPVDGVVSIVEPLRLLDGGSLPARKLFDAGAVVAVASGNDPTRRLVRSPALLLTLMVEVGAVSVAEALWAITRGGAMALGEPDRGRLRPGDVADLVVLDTDTLGDLTRGPDANWASSVIVGGALVSTRSRDHQW